MRLVVFCLVASAVFPSLSRAQVPVIAFAKEESAINFSVKASVALEGKFEQWDATLTYPSTDVTTGVLNIKIQAQGQPAERMLAKSLLPRKLSTTSDDSRRCA
jgi:polyisoprenoid-binding protein YceI